VLPPNFYNQGDQGIYAAGDFFIPQEKFRAAPYSVNKPTNDPNEVPAGIPTVYQSQGGGGGGYTGGISDLTGNFFQTTGDRQDRLRSLNMPLEQKGVPGGDILMENLQGYVGKPDDYLGIEEYNEALQKYSGMEGPQTIKGASGVYSAGAKNTLNRKINDMFYSLPGFSKPQSADQIIADGYTGQSNMPGILGMMIGKMDKYGSLPTGDQAFIARNMGYTGPTVFGANDSGLSKDVFGMNTRSGFGNYAEAVGEQVDSLGESLSGRLSDKYGATFNRATGMFESEDEEAAAKANKMTKMMRAKFNFYTKQVAQRDADRKAAEEAAAAKAAAAAAASRAESARQYDPNKHGSTNYGLGSDGQQSYSGDSIGAGNLGFGTNATTGGPVSNRTGRGRTDYMDGGLADMLEIYD